MSCAALAVTAKIAIAAAALSAAAQAQEGRSLLWALRPGQILVGPQIATTGARLQATREYAALIEPTPAARENWIAPSFGALVSLRWRRWFSLALAPRHESYGLSTREQVVSFPENPFPHTLKSTTELSYTVWPLFVGAGWFGRRQHVQALAGPYLAMLDESKVEWTVDGEPYRNMPPVEYRSSHSGWLLGLEYGLRLGPGELLLGVEAQPGSGPLMEGMQGSVRARVARANLAYAWSVLRQ